MLFACVSIGGTELNEWGKSVEMKAGRESVPRVAASSYLNSVPLIWSFMHGARRHEIELITDTAPARCAEMLARAEVEAALVPVIEYQRIPELAVVPGVCVGSRARVRSVVLVTRDEINDLRKVRRVALDDSSRTSAALVRIIFREFLEREPEWIERAPDVGAMLAESDAALIIGDPGMSFPRERVVVYDLAELWRRHTGLGFVFAMWMAHAGAGERVRRIDFAGARDEALRHIGEIAASYQGTVGLSLAEIESYLRENISYELEAELRAGLDLFYRLAHKHNIIREVRPLNFIGAWNASRQQQGGARMEQLKLPTSQTQPDVDFATLDLLPYGIIVVDEAGAILYYNAREEQISQRRREDVVGKNFFTEVAPCTQVQEFYGKFRETMHHAGLVASFHFHFPFPERPTEVEITLTSFQKDDSNLCLITVSDVTEKDILRDHLLRGARLREVGEVAAGVAHNFNNLLTVIRGNAELLLLRLKDNDFARQRAEKILRASDDGEQMIKRIRESARHHPESPTTMSAVQLNELIKDSIAFTEDYAKASQDERGVRVRFATEMADNLPPVRASASELREVFVNLLRNAIDAVADEGQITVRTRAEDARNVVEISDTGAGMSDEVQAKIFRPLFTTKGERGTGLGLATCYAIVRRHGGDIEVQSELGAGTTFTISLPVIAE